MLLLCSDGLTGPLSDDEIAELLESTDDLEAVAQELIRQANEAGGPDNITVVLARTEEGALPEEVEGRREALRSSTILSNLNGRDLAMLSLYLDEYVHGADHVFESEMGLHLLLEGTAQVEGGRSLVPGNVFGLTPFLDGGESLVSVESTSECTVALLSRGCYALLKERRPSLAVDLLQGLLTEVARRNREV